MSNASDECKDCRWFSPKPNPSKQAADYGMCRVNPPTVHPISGTIKSLWPIVNDSDWCGLFEEPE